MDSLLNSLDNLEAETNEVQKIVDKNYEVRLQMSEQMRAIIQIITLIQEELDKLEDVQDAAEDVAKLKGKIAQNNIKQGELLSKMQVLKQVLEKSPNIEELQTTLNSIKKNLNEDILNHNKFNGNAPPGNSPSQTQNQEDFANSEVLGPPGASQEMQTFGGYRYSGNSPGKIIRSTKSRNRKKTKKNKTKRKRI